jgi:hypothetical protein
MNQQLNISAQGGLNPKRNQALKKGLILGAVVVVGIITYRYFKKKGVLRHIKNLDVFQGGEEGNTGDSTQNYMYQINGFDAFQKAKEIAEAFIIDDTWYAGYTDEDMIWDALDGLTNNEIRAVEEMYNSHFISTTSYNLRNSFRDELSGSELDRALAYLDGITY